MRALRPADLPGVDPSPRPGSDVIPSLKHPENRVGSGVKVVCQRTPPSRPSCVQTDVRRCPQKSTTVFLHDVKSRVAYGVAHQHPRTQVSARCHLRSARGVLIDG
jgi:hypothetical protein